MIAIYKTLLHETVHYGDYLDGKQYQDEHGEFPEIGAAFEDDVFFGENRTAAQGGGRIGNPNIGLISNVDPNMNSNPLQTIIDWGKNRQEKDPSNLGKIIPTLPKKFNVTPIEPLPPSKPCGCIPVPNRWKEGK